MSNDSTNTQLNLENLFEPKTPRKNSHSFSLFNQITMNLSNILGPAIICLPFVIQKAGFLPTTIVLLLICYFSTFSSICLVDSGRLIMGIKINNYRRFDMLHLVDSLITDTILSFASRVCVIFNHLLYSILCIITLNKIMVDVIFQKFALFIPLLDYINRDKIQLDQKIKYESFFNQMNSEIFSNQHLIIVSIIFSGFLVFFMINKFFKKFFNIIIFLMMFFVSFHIFVYFTSFNSTEVIHSMMGRVPMLGNDYTYIYGTVLFSFSYVCTLPSWITEDDINASTSTNYVKRALNYSSMLGVMFQIMFGVSFAYLIHFSGVFSVNDYAKSINDKWLMLSVCVLLISTLLQGIITHIELFFTSIKSYTKLSLNSLMFLIAVLSPFVLSLLLLINGSMFMNLLNWSSLFLFGYVNFVLPLILYIEAVNEAEVFENNYKQSALLDFENFICLKSQEIGLMIMSPEDNKGINICRIVHEIRMRKDTELDSDIKEKIIDTLYEMDGYYSLQRSFSTIFGKLLSSKSKITALFYTIVLLLILCMLTSIYVALYNFFINKTLVVNIFIQTN